MGHILTHSLGRHRCGATCMVSCSPGPGKFRNVVVGDLGPTSGYPVRAGNHKCSPRSVWGCMAVGVRRMACMHGVGLWLPVPKLGGPLSPEPPITHQEEDFLRPSSREEAQKLWEMERLKMQQVLDKQQKQMVEDYQWLRQEEKSLVSGLEPSPALAPSQRCWKSRKKH